MRRALVGLLLALTVSACASGTPVADSADRAGAPLIAAPRDLSSRASDPCRTLLAPDQVRRLGYGATGEFRVDVLGAPTCTWRDDAVGRRSSVSVILTNDQLIDAYRNRFLPIFRPLDIASLPAVDVMSGPQVQTCTTTVGVADGQSLQLNTSVGGGLDGVPDSDPCAEGHRVAEEIVSTLPLR